MAKAEFYVLADVEADGPVPGPFSMSSFGFAVAGVHDGVTFQELDPAERTFYAELRPISDAYDPEAVAISGLDRVRLVRRRRIPPGPWTPRPPGSRKCPINWARLRCSWPIRWHMNRGQGVTAQGSPAAGP
ncbi:hypothetical protein [Streptomyces sp. DSM 40750]|uniref:hypothetical protein n=1 Tax=Streptomyces sp. DSM 40750 TaxID=2801030 RepID=UPI00214C6B57|nr:hypothetical protein [Streptomyces sp. DSM 40750]UUU23829.1 hypothetical protein JIX55_28240 [Streptomyces sp. DSM 40750]